MSLWELPEAECFVNLLRLHGLHMHYDVTECEIIYSIQNGRCGGGGH